MSANIHAFEFSSLNLDSSGISVMTFETQHHNVSLDYWVKVVLSVPKWFDPMVFEGKQATLKIWEGDEAHFLHGWINEYSAGQTIGLDHVQLVLMLSSPLAFLKNTRTSRVFKNKSVQEIITEILIANHWPVNGFEFYNLSGLPKEPWIIQDQESDYMFILHELKRAGLNFSFKQTALEAQLVFFDAKMAETATYFGQKSLECIESKGMGFKGPVIHAWHIESNLEPGVSAPLYALKVITSAKGLIPGQQFSIIDKSQPAINGDYRIIEIQQKGDQRPGFSTWGNKENGIDYINVLTLIPKQFAYQMPFVPKRSMTGPEIAHIEAATGEYPYLNAEGAYHVRFPFDESNSPVGDGSPAITLMQTLAGPNCGHHFPLRAKTEVGISFRHGDGREPIMMGMLSNPETRSPITSDEYSKHRFRSWADNTLEMEELQHEEKVHLFTHHTNNRLLLDAKKENHQVDLDSRYGSVVFYAGETGHIDIQENINQNSLKDNKTVVSGDRECLIETENIALQASKEIYVKSKEEMRLKSIQNSECIAQTLFKVQAKKKVDFKVHKQNFSLSAKAHAVHIKAKNNITFKGKSTGILLSQGDGSISIKKNQMWFKAAEITLKAGIIDIPFSNEKVS